MNVSVYSREQIEKLIEDGIPENTAIISLYDPPSGNYYYDKDYKAVDYSALSNPVFQIAVSDIDISMFEEYNGLDYESYFTEAEELAEFIYEAKAKGLDIICQCEYGQSRSAGCAAAIREHFFGDGISVFADYRYYPNQLVFHKVSDALKNVNKT
jgi:hypothetical protein